MGKGNYFALNIIGDSMIDIGINEGDIAIIKQKNDENIFLKSQLQLYRPCINNYNDNVNDYDKNSGSNHNINDKDFEIDRS